MARDGDLLARTYSVVVSYEHPVPLILPLIRLHVRTVRENQPELCSAARPGWAIGPSGTGGDRCDCLPFGVAPELLWRTVRALSGATKETKKSRKKPLDA